MSETKVCIECNESKVISSYRKGRNQCKECCKIKSMCIHSKQKNLCKECKGASICEHNKIRSNCKECGGGSICEHEKIRSYCKECKGASICEHNKRRTECKECGGGSICEHKKIKINCKECKGSQICIHEKQKNICKDCKGSSICEHNKIKYRCKDCGGSQLCEHNIEKYRCKECKGASICEHNKNKLSCIICNPKKSCIECKSIYSDKRSYCHPLCQACFCNKYPDHEKSTLYKIKERYLRDELRLIFPDNKIDMIFDKIIDDGCSRRKPDILIDLLTYSIIIECDENQHKNYTCENKRTMELFQDLGNRPIIFIRFNPDSYISKNNKVKGCFKPLISIEDIHKKKFYDINKDEWNRRLVILEKVINEYISLDTFPSKEITEIKLFYDNYD